MRDISAKFWATLQFLTIIPTPKLEQPAVPQLSWMPCIGLLIGLILCGLAILASAMQPMLLALLLLLLWFGLTGLLHVDGLADLVDGLAAAHQDKSRLLAVMKEPHIGSFAVMALLLLVLAKFVLLLTLTLASEWYVLLLIPAWARLGAAYWAEHLPALSDGLAAWCKDAGQARLIFWLTVLLLLSWWVNPILMLSPLLLWAWKCFLQHKLGGMNGDCLGAGIEVCELMLLLLCCWSL
ncbi:MAG: adenosylcobinamide-GDP ribazoletransferase [Mariprofundaceae bacterium]|nr:adenosylcobinamide-GDP ribazoletransferase [Mariprofundaceae bacterium]